MEYKDHSYTKSTKLMLSFYHLLQKGLVDMHDQYDEEAEGENGKTMMMMTTKMLKYLVLTA